MNFTLNRWIVIFPQDLKIIRREFDKIGLKTASIILIDDELSEQDIARYAKFCNDNLEYNHYINTTHSKDLNESIEALGGAKDDHIYIIKDGKTAQQSFLN